MRQCCPFGASLLLLGCAIAPTSQTPMAPVQVLSRSHNRSAVDVYLLCGDHAARLLGLVPQRGTESFEFPAEDAVCIEGLNFFLVIRNTGRGYWVGPFRPRAGEYINLVIERYAGLSTAHQLR